MQELRQLEHNIGNRQVNATNTKNIQTSRIQQKESDKLNPTHTQNEKSRIQHTQNEKSRIKHTKIRQVECNTHTHTHTPKVKKSGGGELSLIHI